MKRKLFWRMMIAGILSLAFFLLAAGEIYLFHEKTDIAAMLTAWDYRFADRSDYQSGGGTAPASVRRLEIHWDMVGNNDSEQVYIRPSEDDVFTLREAEIDEFGTASEPTSDVLPDESTEINQFSMCRRVKDDVLSIYPGKSSYFAVGGEEKPKTLIVTLPKNHSLDSVVVICGHSRLEINGLEGSELDYTRVKGKVKLKCGGEHADVHLFTKDTDVTVESSGSVEIDNENGGVKLTGGYTELKLKNTFGDASVALSGKTKSAELDVTACNVDIRVGDCEGFTMNYTNSELVYTVRGESKPGAFLYGNGNTELKIKTSDNLITIKP